ncbi:hypothetical protein F444_05210, partial [Phytophthora nicotianae P1976]
MALAQALVDTDLASQDDSLEAIARSLKQGICWTGQLNLHEQFDHYVRTTTLVNVMRGWEGMPSHESTKQFKWYLEEYAGSPSSRDSIVPKYNWGCSEFMAMAANFLQREIYVLAYDTDHKKQWYCSMYKPSTTKRGTQTYEIGQHIPLLVGRCTALIRAAKMRDTCPPLVIRHWGEHYSAFVHKRAPVSQPQQPDQVTGSQPSSCAQEPGHTQPLHDGDSSQVAWSLTGWDGNVTELRRKLTGLTISHDLKCEIHLILEHADPS